MVEDGYLKGLERLLKIVGQLAQVFKRSIRRGLGNAFRRRQDPGEVEKPLAGLRPSVVAGSPPVKGLAAAEERPVAEA